MGDEAGTENPFAYGSGVHLGDRIDVLPLAGQPAVHEQGAEGPEERVRVDVPTGLGDSAAGSCAALQVQLGQTGRPSA